MRAGLRLRRQNGLLTAKPPHPRRPSSVRLIEGADLLRGNGVRMNVRIAVTSWFRVLCGENQAAHLQSDRKLLAFGIVRADLDILEPQRHRIFFHRVKELRDVVQSSASLDPALEGR